jgi:hypothetical protein
MSRGAFFFYKALMYVGNVKFEMDILDSTKIVVDEPVAGVSLSVKRPSLLVLNHIQILSICIDTKDE